MFLASTRPTRKSSGTVMKVVLGLLQLAHMLGGDALVLLDDDIAALVGDVEARDLALQALGHELHLRAGVHQAELVVDEEVREDVFRRQADRLEQDRHRHLAAAIDAEEQDVLRVELEVEPRAAVRNDARREQQLAARMRLALVVLEEHARAAVQLRDDHALGAVDDEGAVVGHERHFAHVDLLLLDLLDGLGLHGFTVVDDHLQLGAHGRRVRQAALLALARVERGLGHAVLDELHLDIAVVRDDRERVDERGLQALGFAFGRRHFLLQEGDVAVLLHRQQVGNVEHAVARAEAFANAFALGVAVVRGGCLRHVETLLCRNACLGCGYAFRGNCVGCVKLTRRSGGWPLPTAGGQPRHCTSVRPNRFPAVESGNTAMPEGIAMLRTVLPGARGRACALAGLLHFGFGAGVDQLLHGSFGVGLGDGFLDGLRRAVHQVLGFLQAQAGDLAHGLDDAAPCWRRFRSA